MKTIRFTQSINLSVTIDAEVPDNWTDDDIDDFVTDCHTYVNVDEPDDPAYNGRDVKLVSVHLDGAEITDGTLWDS